MNYWKHIGHMIGFWKKQNFFVKWGSLAFVGGLLCVLMYSVFGKNVQKDPTLERKPTTVQVVLVERGPIARQTNLSGEVKAVDSIPIIIPIQGVVASIHFKEGEKVKKGDVLIRLDDTQVKAEFHEAQARFKEAQGAYHRSQELYRRGFGSSAETEKSLAQFNVSKAQLEKAKHLMNQTKVTAPFDGYMSIRSISIGAFVTPNQEIAHLVSLDPLYVDFSVPESLYSSLTVGSEVSITIPGGDVLPYNAKIFAVNPSVDPISRNVMVRATLPNPDKVFRPGMFAKVSLPLGQEDNALVIPEIAVTKEGDRSFVFVIKGGRADQRSVTVGLKEGEKIQVVDGLEEGEEVVTEGLFKLYDGAPVRVISQDKVN
jgi:membrane fusion protein, multidrug efflux system